MAILSQYLRSGSGLSPAIGRAGTPTSCYLGRRHLEAETEILSALLHEWRDGRGPTPVRSGSLGRSWPPAAWMLGSQRGLIPEVQTAIRHQRQSTPVLRHDPAEFAPERPMSCPEPSGADR